MAASSSNLFAQMPAIMPAKDIAKAPKIRKPTAMRGCGGVIAVNADRFLEAGHDEIGVAISVEVSGAGVNSVSDDQDECPSKPVLQELLQGHFCAAEQQAYMGYGDF